PQRHAEARSLPRDAAHRPRLADPGVAVPELPPDPSPVPRGAVLSLRQGVRGTARRVDPARRSGAKIVRCAAALGRRRCHAVTPRAALAGVGEARSAETRGDERWATNAARRASRRAADAGSMRAAGACSGAAARSLAGVVQALEQLAGLHPTAHAVLLTHAAGLLVAGVLVAPLAGGEDLCVSAQLARAAGDDAVRRRRAGRYLAVELRGLQALHFAGWTLHRVVGASD